MADPVRDLRDRGVTVLEDPTTPTFLSLTATEWHAFGFGLKEGLWFWKRTPLAWDEIKKMEALPEDCALLGCVGYLVMTNAPALVKVALSFFGSSG